MGEDGEIQSTEDRIGPYELNDFFLHHVMRFGQRPPRSPSLPGTPGAMPRTDCGRPASPRPSATNTTSPPSPDGWRRSSLRFFGFSQFKRSAIPNGPKVSSGGALSPRGDWRAPSDAVADVWLAELRDNLPG